MKKLLAFWMLFMLAAPLTFSVGCNEDNGGEYGEEFGEEELGYEEIGEE